MMTHATGKGRALHPFTVGLYCPPLLSGYGGAQRYTAAIASYLSESYRGIRLRVVADFADNARFTDPAGLLEARYGFRIGGGTEFAASPGPEGGGLPGKALRHARLRRLSSDCGLFINCFHNVHYFRARRNVHVIHFPAARRVDASPTFAGSALGRLAGAALDRRYWSSYDLSVCNSDFSLTWLRRYWGEDASRQCILYPPVAVEGSGPAGGRKSDIILMCSRFDPRKKLLEGVRYFVENQERFAGYGLVVAGSVSESPEERSYLRDVERAAEGARVKVVPSPSPDTLARLYQEAAIFWHLMGLDVDEAHDPLDVEHFGITTVEAMAAGAVPLVMDRGGQREIVQDGVSGFLCEGLERIGAITASLTHDAQSRARLSAAARERCGRFSNGSFMSAIDRLFADYRLIPPEYHV